MHLLRTLSLHPAWKTSKVWNGALPIWSCLPRPPPVPHPNTHTQYSTPADFINTSSRAALAPQKLTLIFNMLKFVSYMEEEKLGQCNSSFSTHQQPFPGASTNLEMQHHRSVYTLQNMLTTMPSLLLMHFVTCMFNVYKRTTKTPCSPDLRLMSYSCRLPTYSSVYMYNIYINILCWRFRAVWASDSPLLCSQNLLLGHFSSSPIETVFSLWPWYDITIVQFQQVISACSFQVIR